RGPGVQASLRIFSMKDRKETALQQPVSGYALSADGTKLLAGTGGSGYTLIDANPGGERTKKTVSVSGLVTEIDPAQEGQQIFNGAGWRYRDWFYVLNMHGFDWEQAREDCRKWMPHVAHRGDLNYVISETCSELTVQHAYIDGGDFKHPSRIGV